MVMNVSDPSTWKPESGGNLSESTESTEQVPG